MNEELAMALLNWEDHDEADYFLEASPMKITGTGRWRINYSMVYQDTRDQRYWMIRWSRGATEVQDEGPENIVVYEVRPIEIMVTEWERVKPTPQERVDETGN